MEDAAVVLVFTTVVVTVAAAEVAALPGVAERRLNDREIKSPGSRSLVVDRLHALHL